ncbi:MAG: hypothetical protein WCE61_14180 [Candidatus Acidiferrum sp.]
MYLTISTTHTPASDSYVAQPILAVLFVLAHMAPPMVSKEEYVYVYKKIPTNREEQVAAIKLADGQSVKKIE